MATEWFDQRRKPLRQDRPIILEAKQTGERRAGNPHAAFDEAGTGNVAWSRCCDTRRRKGEKTVNTNIDLTRRASPRPYLGAPGGEIPPGDSTNRAGAGCDQSPIIAGAARVSPPDGR